MGFEYCLYRMNKTHYIFENFVLSLNGKYNNEIAEQNLALHSYSLECNFLYITLYRLSIVQWKFNFPVHNHDNVGVERSLNRTPDE